MNPENAPTILGKLQELTDDQRIKEGLMPLVAEVGADNLEPKELIQKLGEIVIDYADEHMSGARIPALNMIPQYADVLLEKEEDKQKIPEAWQAFRDNYKSPPPTPDRKTKKALAKPHYMRGHVEHKRIARHRKRSS